jgi:uncharacterized protein (TIGR02302 family)
MTAPAPETKLNRRAAARLTILTLLARLALTWERLWPRLLPLLVIVAGFISLALLDVLPGMPFWLHVLVLVGFAAAFSSGVVFLWRGRYATSRQAARHRIERDSHIPHRPLTALEDQPLIAGGADASGDVWVASSAERALWAAHLTRMRLVLARLRVAVPSPGMARLDPLGLRWAVALLLLIAVAAGSGEAGARLQRALLPNAGAADGSVLALDIWITPPTYTQVPPVLLQGQAGSDRPAMDEVSIPVGSTVLAQLGSADDAAHLMIGARAVPFNALDAEAADQGRQVEAEIDDEDLAAKTLEVRLAKQVLDSWPVRVVPDQKPQVEFLAPPRNMGKGLLGLQFEARDDYGLTDLKLLVRHQQRWTLSDGREAAAYALPIPNSGTAAGKGNATRDFSDHPWAGEVVEITLRAIDAANQEVETDPITLALPERIFNHPVARALISARKKLNRPEDGVVPDVVSDLEDIAERPQHFFDDTVVFLSLAVARARLSHDGGVGSRADVQRLLWETALRIEDGEFAVAERDLKDIQERLNKALRDGANDAEIERLMDQLQRAMAQYMTALADHLKRKGMTDPQNNPSTQMMESADLQRMLERARELNQAGARDAARKMLSQLNQMLNAIRRGAQLAQPPSGANQGRRMLKGLRELERRQQKLLDQTFRQQQQGQQGKPDAAQKLAPGQSQLRRDLGRLMLQMGEMLGAIPPSVGRAERAMKGAGKALRDGDAKRAGRDQGEALSELRRATDSLAEQLARQRQGQGTMGFGMGQQRGPMGQGRDPFGRRSGNGPNGNVDGGDVKVPTQREILRAREIMQELRRRSGEQFRPRPERDYIERLIKRF